MLVAVFDFELPEPDALLNCDRIIVEHNHICGLCPQSISFHDLPMQAVPLMLLPNAIESSQHVLVDLPLDACRPSKILTYELESQQ